MNDDHGGGHRREGFVKTDNEYTPEAGTKVMPLKLSTACHLSYSYVENYYASVLLLLKCLDSFQGAAATIPLRRESGPLEDREWRRADER